MKKFLNKRRRASLVAYNYKLSELLIAGIGLTGILQDNPNWGIIIWGVVMAIFFLLIGLFMDDDESDQS